MHCIFSAGVCKPCYGLDCLNKETSYLPTKIDCIGGRTICLR